MVLLLLETVIVSSLLFWWDRQDTDPESSNNRGKIAFLLLCCSFLTVARLGPCRTRASSCYRGTRLLGTVKSAWDGPSRGCTGSWHDTIAFHPSIHPILIVTRSSTKYVAVCSRTPVSKSCLGSPLAASVWWPHRHLRPGQCLKLVPCQGWRCAERSWS